MRTDTVRMNQSVPLADVTLGQACPPRGLGFLPYTVSQATAEMQSLSYSHCLSGPTWLWRSVCSGKGTEARVLHGMLLPFLAPDGCRISSNGLSGSSKEDLGQTLRNWQVCFLLGLGHVLLGGFCQTGCSQSLPQLKKQWLDQIPG